MCSAHSYRSTNCRGWEENMIQYLQDKFQEYYTPGRKIYIDESIVCFKGHLTFRSFK
jgi:hypothetical protein